MREKSICVRCEVWIVPSLSPPTPAPQTFLLPPPVYSSAGCVQSEYYGCQITVNCSAPRSSPSWWLKMTWCVAVPSLTNPQQRGLCCGQIVFQGKTKGIRESSHTMRGRSPVTWVSQYSALQSFILSLARTWHRWTLVTKGTTLAAAAASSGARVVWSFPPGLGRNTRSWRSAHWSGLRAARLSLPDWRSPSVTWACRHVWPGCPPLLPECLPLLRRERNTCR